MNIEFNPNNRKFTFTDDNGTITSSASLDVFVKMKEHDDELTVANATSEFYQGVSDAENKCVCVTRSVA